MATRRLMLSAITRTNRHQVMAEINDAVMAAGGWVVGHTLFSNMATAFQLMLPSGRIGSFAQTLQALGVRFDEESLAQFGSLPAGAAQAEDEMPISLNVTFVHDEPDLRRDVPAVPG